MTKRRKKKKTKKVSIEKYLKYLVWVLSIVATLLVLFLAGYYFGYNSAKDEIDNELTQKEKQTKEALDKLEKIVKQKQTLNKKLENILKKEQKRYDITAAHEVDDKKVLKPRTKKPHLSSTKPKLAIIFDDVSTKSQVKAIKSLNLKVTLSFFPPSKSHPNTPKLASKEKFYMIHLPMEAMHFHKEEPFTLRTSDSRYTIEKRIKKIKELFPRTKFINNHTGSKYTSDYTAMKNLIYVLDKYNIKFIDSRTTSQTKVPKLMRELGRKYIARDVFLDHKGDVASIIRQIKLAIKLAKRDGVAIAIGHPHPNTILALAKSKKLFKDVELVYINELY